MQIGSVVLEELHTYMHTDGIWRRGGRYGEVVCPPQ